MPETLPRITIAPLAVRNTSSLDGDKKQEFFFELSVPNELISQALVRTGYSLEQQETGARENFEKYSEISGEFVKKRAEIIEKMTNEIDRYLARSLTISKKPVPRQFHIHERSSWLGGKAYKSDYANFSDSLKGSFLLPIDIIGYEPTRATKTPDHMLALFKQDGREVEMKTPATEKLLADPKLPRTIKELEELINAAALRGLGLSGVKVSARDNKRTERS